MRKNTVKNVENFAELMFEYPSMLKVGEYRYTIGRSWVYKKDIDTYLNGCALTIAKNLIKNLDVNNNKEKAMGVQLNRIESVSKKNIKDKVHNLKGDDGIAFEYEGKCYSWDCSMNEAAMEISGFFAKLDFNEERMLDRI